MGCFGNSESRFTKHHSVTALEQNRGCTDIFFLLLYIFGWIAVVSIFIQATKQGGDPEKIIRGVDVFGRICGVSDGVKDKPYAAFPYPPTYSAKICVSSCNYTNEIYDSSVVPNGKSQMAWRYRSKKFLYYCVPAPVQGGVSVDITLSGDFDDWAETVSRAVGDLFTVYPLFIYGAILAVVMTFVWAFFVRYIAGFLVWISILLLIIAGGMLSALIIKTGNDMDTTEGTNRKKIVQYTGYIILGATIIFTFMVIALKKRINIAIEVVKEASRAINDVKAIVFFPIIPILSFVAYFIFWFAAALYIFSVSNLEPQTMQKEVTTYPLSAGFLAADMWPTLQLGQNTGLWDELNSQGMCKGADYLNNPKVSDNICQMRKFKVDAQFRNLAALHFFHLLWHVQFLFYFGYLVTAGTIAYWYFQPRNSQGNKSLNHTPVCHSITRAVRYHLGTVAFGSLIIAMIQFIRYVIMYIEAKTKDKEENELHKILFCLIHCCLKCVECCMDKINKHALIWTAIWGDSFCVAACSSFALIWRNLARVAALSMVSHFLFALGKVMIAAATTGVMLYIMRTTSPYDEDVYSPVVPLLILFMISYIIASLFMLIFASAVDTIFICFLVDEENNGKGEMLASDSLQKLVGKYEAHSKKAAHRHQIRRPGHAEELKRQETRTKLVKMQNSSNPNSGGATDFE